VTTNWFVSALRQHSEIAFFLTLAIGYLVGRLRIGNLSLGAVTGTLVVGVLIGQLGITISPEVRQCFFVLFLFSIGYRCGPQFFQGLGKDGLSHAALSVIIAVTALLVVYTLARFFGYDGGTAGGVVAGALTQSATIGTAGDAIARLPISEAVRATMTNHIPVAFAVTYLIGVVGSAWFLSQIGPLIMQVNLAKVCAEYEAGLGVTARKPPGIISAHRDIELRAYRIPEDSTVTARPVRDILPGARFFVERIRRGGEIFDAKADTVLEAGDVVAFSGPRGLLVEQIQSRLPEVEDAELLDVPAEQVDVFVTSSAVSGKTLLELSEAPFARGVYLRRLRRDKLAIPIAPTSTVQRGDVLTLVGIHHNVETAIAFLGVADRPEESTDMTFVSAGIVVGALIGLPALAFGKLQLGLSLSVGVLLAGLLWGWLHSRRPILGHIPSPTLWIFESLGLTGFIAVVGLAAGPDFVQGLQSSGISLVIAGVLTVVIPQLVGIMVGQRIFRIHPGILLGVCAGAGTAAPARAPNHQPPKRSVPTLGFGVAYAIGNVLLALWGTVIVALLA
jgi:putative transport protein